MRNGVFIASKVSKNNGGNLSSFVTVKVNEGLYNEGTNGENGEFGLTKRYLCSS